MIDLLGFNVNLLYSFRIGALREDIFLTILQMMKINCFKDFFKVY